MRASGTGCARRARELTALKGGEGAELVEAGGDTDSVGRIDKWSLLRRVVDGDAGKTVAGEGGGGAGRRRGRHRN